MSILCNDIPAYFAPWKRLFMSVMLMCGVGPLITWGKVRRLRVSLLRWLCLGGVIAAFYYAGIYIFMYTHYCSWMSRYAWVFEHAIVISMLVSALSAIGALWVCHIMAGPWQLRRDLLLLPVLGVCVYSLIMTSSRVAAAGFMFALVMLLLHYFYRRSRGIGRRIPALKVVVLIGLILFTGYSLLDPMDRALMLIKFQNVENNEGDYLNSRRSKWEARSQEISTNIITGIGFSSQVLGDVPTDTIKSTDLQRTGEILPVRNVEPGSSWLSVISTIGIIGFLAVVWLYLSCFVSAWRHSSRLHVMLLSFFAVHLMVEGYIFGFGSCLCFILWTLLGASFRREYPGIKIHRKV